MATLVQRQRPRPWLSSPPCPRSRQKRCLPVRRPFIFLSMLMALLMSLLTSVQFLAPPRRPTSAKVLAKEVPRRFPVAVLMPALFLELFAEQVLPFSQVAVVNPRRPLRFYTVQPPTVVTKLVSLKICSPSVRMSTP
ncbi:unnamed protein product [Prorocentrum cordatum]|uniref:Uncharacterized protein n=1 Tax=Prorocentrum cordatum TaxID=2364126 RepID=A0ABN9RU81_9DINO|nr:unnamed protein product [Polarella glacialis]